MQTDRSTNRQTISESYAKIELANNKQTKSRSYAKELANIAKTDKPGLIAAGVYWVWQSENANLD